jgi:hypothetical protein
MLQRSCKPLYSDRPASQADGPRAVGPCSDSSVLPGMGREPMRSPEIRLLQADLSGSGPILYLSNSLKTSLSVDQTHWARLGDGPGTGRDSLSPALV